MGAGVLQSGTLGQQQLGQVAVGPVLGRTGDVTCQSSAQARSGHISPGTSYWGERVVGGAGHNREGGLETEGGAGVVHGRGWWTQWTYSACHGCGPACQAAAVCRE